MAEKIYDVTIIGGGPAGMFASFYCGLHELDAQLIESLPQLGGQVGALYPEKQVWDVAGMPGVTGHDLIAKLEEQMAVAPIDQFLGETVEDVIKEDDGTFTIKSAKRVSRSRAVIIALGNGAFTPRKLGLEGAAELEGKQLSDDGTFTIKSAKRVSRSRAVIIALGNGAFTPRKLGLEGAAELEGKQLSYFVNHKADYVDKRVAILGGGDSAIDIALMLEPVAKEVHLVHRRDQFRGLEHTVTQLKQSSVAILGGGDSAIDIALMLEPVAKEVHLVHRRDQFRGLEHTVTQLKQSSVQLDTPFLPRALTVENDETVTLDLKKMRSDDEAQLNVDKIVVNYGFTSNNAALNQWSLDLAAERNLIKVDSMMETSIDGVYAIGDGVTYPGKVALIAAGFGEAPTAVTALAKKLYPDKRMAMHSSSMGITK